MILHLGVLDITYAEANGDGTTTTGFVAEKLEQNYSVMQTFVDLNRDKIAGVLADSVAASIQDLVNGAPVKSPTFGGEQKIEALFRTFIYGGEMQRIADKFGATVSKAAQKGVSSRRKTPTAKRAPRPAFVDTGTFVASFRAWVEK